MSRYRGPKLKITRRLGSLPGLTSKISKKKNPPGQHGGQNLKPSQYGIRLIEKQKLRYNYGVSEKQLFSYLKKARKNSRSTAQVLLEFLEMRLDNILYRAGFTKTINSARQLITHQHIIVNKRKVTIPSYQCKIHDKIEFSPNSKINKKSLMSTDTTKIPSFLSVSIDQPSLQIKNLISRSDLQLDLNELLVIEYYSQR